VVQFGDWVLQKLVPSTLQGPEDEHAQNFLPSRFNLNCSFAAEADGK